MMAENDIPCSANGGGVLSPLKIILVRSGMQGLLIRVEENP